MNDQLKQFNFYFKTYILVFLIVFIISGCYTSNGVNSNGEEEKVNEVVVTNFIDEINVKGFTTFEDTVDDVTVTFTPIDTRLFNREIVDARNFDGHHSRILSFTNELKDNEDNISDELTKLTKKLSEEGFTIEAIEFIRDIISNESEAEGNTYIYTDPNIYFSDLTGVNPLNPFTFDGRYLTVVEVKIDNQSDSYISICTSELLVTGKNEVFRHIPKDDLLSDIQVGSIKYEVLHKLLMEECEDIPNHTEFRTYLVFPSFYGQDQLSFHFKNKNVSLSNEIQIERSRQRYDYVFNKAKIEGSNKGYIVLSEGRTEGTKSGDFYHFLKFGESLRYVGFKDFLIHNEINLSEIEIVSIEIGDEQEEVNIKRNRLTKEDLTDGNININ